MASVEGAGASNASAPQSYMTFALSYMYAQDEGVAESNHFPPHICPMLPWRYLCDAWNTQSSPVKILITICRPATVSYPSRREPGDMHCLRRR